MLKANYPPAGSIAERKTFIRRFIKKIWIDYPSAIIEYTIPLNDVKEPKKAVLAGFIIRWG